MSKHRRKIKARDLSSSNLFIDDIETLIFFQNLKHCDHE